MNEAQKKAVSQFLAEVGRKGGLSKSDRKRKAVVKNLKKANAARLRRKEENGESNSG